MSHTTRTGLAAEPHSRTDERKARPALNHLSHGRFSRHDSLLNDECVRAIAASVLPSRISLRTLNINCKLPFEPPQLIHSKRKNFGSNPGSNTVRTPDEPRSDPVRTPSEPHSNPIRTNPDTHSNPRTTPMISWLPEPFHLDQGHPLTPETLPCPMGRPPSRSRGRTGWGYSSLAFQMSWVVSQEPSGWRRRILRYLAVETEEGPPALGRAVTLAKPRPKARLPETETSS